ncbi:hypothetical protein DFQ01_107103 [Paenibacillus cellulosilyticus]|uniref:Butirosin biosynthesis protein H-like n=1 Tax=Paenibacillus cellulosilyticus TaxID=375489 RepID=A0A2V2YU53_9BACL|nr:hypothetical protein [Paenibacillus cellulosilyticus]PWW03206.1 hypothetical protein DFQ01_107103 [Paenibacillus cellulosilyticus]QKS43696.1 hypothetical protein HUB94_04045 [Paenibacillus cellulosilyticus]
MNHLPSHPTLLFNDILHSPTAINWRYQDQAGLSDRSLDCLQLCTKEVLLRQHVAANELLPVFLNPFDCHLLGEFHLRRSLPTLNHGWKVGKYPLNDKSDIRSFIKLILEAHRYALIFYQADKAAFSTYYKKHSIIHWAIVADVTDSSLILIDDTLVKDFLINGQVGIIPWSHLDQCLRYSNEFGVAILERLPDSSNETWETTFHRIIRDSVHAMLHCGGLARLQTFINHLYSLSHEQLNIYLEHLEFDINYYRKLRELWLLAVVKRQIPRSLLHADWAEELIPLCKSWSLVMGILMKWKKQPERDYRSKLNEYLIYMYDLETKLMRGLEPLTGDLCH